MFGEYETQTLEQIVKLLYEIKAELKRIASALERGKQ